MRVRVRVRWQGAREESEYDSPLQDYWAADLSTASASTEAPRVNESTRGELTRPPGRTGSPGRRAVPSGRSGAGTICMEMSAPPLPVMQMCDLAGCGRRARGQWGQVAATGTAIRSDGGTTLVMMPAVA